MRSTWTLEYYWGNGAGLSVRTRFRTRKEASDTAAELRELDDDREKAWARISVVNTAAEAERIAERAVQWSTDTGVFAREGAK